jgi:polysaccharide biosynthesis/export protein
MIIMKKALILAFSVIILAGCTSQKQLAYLNNLPETTGENYFKLNIPYYKVQPRDIVYVSVKIQTPDGGLTDILTGQNSNVSNQVAGESTQYVTGYSVDPEGMLNLPLLGRTPVNGNNIYEIREKIQARADSLFRHAYVETRLMSFRYTVIGEVRNPGCYYNYSDQLTVLEAIGHAGGVGDFGSRKNVLVIRPIQEQTVTYKLNLQDKSILESPAYFIAPNDVIIIQETRKKVFNLNLPVYSLIISTVTGTITTALLINNYLKN